MAPNYPPHGNGSEKRNESEDTEPPSETESLLAPAISNQMLPSTPTLGTSLAAPWRHHQGSAPSSPHLSGARSLTVSPVVSRKNYMRKEYEKRSRPSSSGGRKAIRWIGVNGSHDHHPLSSSSIDIGSPHLRSEGAPQTPHIIVSPETETQEPFFVYSVHDTDSPDLTSQIKVEDVEAKISSTSLNVSNTDQSIKLENETPIGSQSSFIQELHTRMGGDIIQIEEGLNTLDNQITNVDTNKPPQYYSEFSADSSSSNSPVEDRPSGYFGNNEVPVVVPNGPLDFTSRSNTLPHVRTDNNLEVHRNHVRSNSISVLPPSCDSYVRKTRKTSMMGMMKRVSSGSGLCLRTPREMSLSRLSIATNNTNNTITKLDWKTQMNDALIVCVSALYAKLLVVMGMAFPIAEIISNDVPLIFYNSFYLYLYFGSIFFLIYAYIFLLRTKSLSTDAFKNQVHSIRMKMPRLEVNWSEIPMPKSLRNVLPKKKEPDGRADKDDKISVTTSAYKPPKYTITETSNHGSMYLKMGAVLFGIGSMIYSGLEFGQYFELRSGADCGNILMAISPIARMIFTFLQMYFIFLNSRVAISKHTTIARFGLMHMIGTNLCIWLNVLVQETKHEIAHLTLYADEHHADLFPGHSVESHSKDHHSSILGDDHHDSNESFDSEEVLDHLLTKSALNHTHHNVVRRTVPAQDELSGCRRINLMGNVVSSASPFLFPCTIEYSLLCAGVLYVMWKNINFSKSEKNMADGDSDISTFIARKVRHHYSVDCARASRGLFTGIFILVLTIISLILFYVLISNDKFKRFAILEANIIELSIYSLAIISVIVGMKQMRELEFILEGDIELDNILLIIAQAGVYIYASFTIIGGYFSLQASHTLPLLTAVLTLIQTTLQTLFILDGSRRCCYTADQLDRKPGREMVTFLLVCNLAMWAISTFETSRADVHPTQLHFYGIWAWTIISHVSMPLAIFYRFHVTVCLGEIWKRSYKLKTDFMGL